jgi:hypothetical protein
MNAPIKPPDKFAEAKRFLLALSPDGPWTLTAIRPFSAFGGRRTETLFCTTIEQAESFIAEHNGKLNLHFTANPVHHVTDKPRERDIEWIIFVQIDVDKDAYGQRLTPESKQRLVENLQSAAFLKNSGLPGPPTFIIDSGNGIQALWRLDPQLSPTSENLHRIKQMNAFAIETTNGDKGTHNPVHLARLPGTTNIPSASKLKDGLVECQSKLLVSTGLVYPPSAFQQKEVLHLVAEGTSIIGAADPIESLDTLLKWNVRESTKRIVVEGFDSEGKIEDDSPSGWQHKGVIELIEHGVPDAIIKGIITDEKWGISGSVLKERSREVDAYADRQIQRAHKSIEAYRRSEFPDDGVDLMEYGESESEEPQGESESDAPPKKPRRREHSLLESLEWVDPPFLIDG